MESKIKPHLTETWNCQTQAYVGLVLFFPPILRELFHPSQYEEVTGIPSFSLVRFYFIHHLYNTMNIHALKFDLYTMYF